MFHFVRRTAKILLYNNANFASTKHPIAKTHLHVFLLRQNPFSLKPFSSLSNNNLIESQTPSSFTISYLINSCGLSPESALSASKRFHLETKEKADSALSFFRTHGFTQSHISDFIAKCPSLLVCDPDNTLKPKIEFFHRSGISGPALAKILYNNPSILKSSLKNQIIPSFNFLKSFVHKDEAVVAALQRSSRVLRINCQKIMMPNISTLRSHGVPDSRISKMIVNRPRAIELRPDQFSERVHLVKEMGFEPQSSLFIHAVMAMSVMSRSTWEGKLAVFQSLGWSKYDALLAFRKQPLCMLVSEKKLRRSLDFFANSLGMKPSFLCQRPNLLLLSLEKRVKPRCSVLEVLISKSLIKERLHVSSTLTSCSEKDFLRKFVIKYQEEAPELLNAYKGKLDVGLGDGLKEAVRALVL